MLIKGVSFLRSGSLVKGRDILIEGGRIAKIDRDLRDEEAEIIDGHGMLAIPGLVNCHTHLAMTLLRGYADDMALDPWLNEKIWPMEGRLNEEDIIWGVKLGCLELIRFGICCYNDMYYHMNETAEATKEMGLRAFLSEVIFDDRLEALSASETFINRWSGDPLIHPAIGPHAIKTCAQQTLLRARDIAEKYDVILHIHLSEIQKEVDGSVKEHGKSPVEYLDSLGLLGPRTIAAHCVWLSEKDISILARRQVNVAHCPVSNLKLASGIAPINKMLAAGINVCLGTDGASSNNNLNLFEEMKTMAIVQKNECGNPEVLKADETWKIATDNAYRAFGLDIGLHEGALADLALIDLRRPWFKPETNMISHLIYSNPGIADTTIVNGKVLMLHGAISGEEKILDNAQKRFERLTTGS
ncbi:MAG TPA: amidohydrolase [Methanotrichaceae archaeon]|nr:amidohydrolase [Methanotrichaceae archaeon]